MKGELLMPITATGWKNKGGTSTRSCKCGSWKQHWIKISGENWPSACSVKRCTTAPSLGGHIYNPNVSGEKIVPMCSTCNARTDAFDLNGGVTLVSANKSETCEK